MAKLILTNEVAGLGSAGDVIEVKNGYARNYLIPQGFAVAWTRGGEKQVASIRAARESRAIHDHEEAVALKDALESNTVKLPVKAGKEGRLFGSVTTADIAAAISATGRPSRFCNWNSKPPEVPSSPRMDDSAHAHTSMTTVGRMTDAPRSQSPTASASERRPVASTMTIAASEERMDARSKTVTASA